MKNVDNKLSSKYLPNDWFELKWYNTFYFDSFIGPQNSTVKCLVIFFPDGDQAPAKQVSLTMLTECWFTFSRLLTSRVSGGSVCSKPQEKMKYEAFLKR